MIEDVLRAAAETIRGMHESLDLANKCESAIADVEALRKRIADLERPSTAPEPRADGRMKVGELWLAINSSELDISSVDALVQQMGDLLRISKLATILVYMPDEVLERVTGEKATSALTKVVYPLASQAGLSVTFDRASSLGKTTIYFSMEQ